MTQSVWRIATDTSNYTADDLDGAGAKATGGRWNRQGVALVYCSSSIALACLETVVHLNGGGLPLNRYLVRIDIPDTVWTAAIITTAASAPVGWDAIPAGQVSLNYGDHWVASGSSAVMLVPSIIVPEEQNALINPLHADAAAITATKLRRWLYDPRIT